MRALYRRFVQERPGLLLVLSLISLAPTGYLSAKLYGDVRADLRELLPSSARSVKTLRELERRFGGWSQLSVVIESADREANRKFSDELVDELKKVDSVRSARNKLGEERDFFEARWWLLAELGDLEEVRDRIDDAITRAKIRANPLLVDLDEPAATSTTPKRVELDLSDIEKKYDAKIGLAARFPDRYFERLDESAKPPIWRQAIIVRRRGLAFGVVENQAVITAVEAAIARLDPKKFHPSLEVGLGGDVKNIVEEHTSLVEDLVTSAVIVGLLMAVVVVGYYRRWRSLWVVGYPLLVGSLWTFGLSQLLIGHLNASSAFLGAIVPGNGINFGLIMFARYIEERRARVAPREALADSIGFTWRATSTAAIAASISYASLMATDFLGFSDFGLIGGIGMIFCWISMFTVLPALISYSEKRWPMDLDQEIRWLGPVFQRLATWPAEAVRRFHAPIGIGGLLLAIVAAALTVGYLKDPFEKDFTKLRSTVTLERGAAVWEAKVDQIFGRYLAPQVIVAEREEDVGHIVAAIQRSIDEGGPRAPISEVTALSTLVPKEQSAKLEVLAEIRELLSDDVLEGLEGDQRKLAEKYRPPSDLEGFDVKDLPETVRADFRELDGSEGRVVLALPNLALNLYHADEIRRVAALLRQIQLPDGRVVESSGNFVIYSDMLDSVMGDGPRATILSFLGVALLCAFVFRRPVRVFTVVGSLFVGVVWLGGLLATMGYRINFLNFIALPITFGIGVDYAVNIYGRFLLEREKAEVTEATVRSIVATGGAVVLCSLTTIIGYGSLLVARNGALISFGDVAIFGELTCLAAAMLVMPSWIVLWQRRK
ncbi:MAG: MMPL family transporter [Deltaproteobacteria bacterium]|nr:MMPL family transporter [Deltaproteobacteria bacterium]